MAQFRAVIQGAGKAVSRLGNKVSGINANINGWDSGIEVKGYYSENLKADVFDIYATGGSYYHMRKKHIGYFYLTDEGDVVLGSGAIRPK